MIRADQLGKNYDGGIPLPSVIAAYRRTAVLAPPISFNAEPVAGLNIVLVLLLPSTRLIYNAPQLSLPPPPMSPNQSTRSTPSPPLRSSPVTLGRGPRYSPQHWVLLRTRPLNCPESTRTLNAHPRGVDAPEKIYSSVHQRM